MTYQEKAVKGVSWQILGLLISLPIGYFIRVLYARELSKPDVGLFYSLLDLFGLLAIFRGFGISAAIVRYIPKFLAQKDLNQVKGAILFGGIFLGISSLVFTGLIFLFAPLIVKVYFGKSSLDLQFIIFCFYVMAVGYYLGEGIFGYVGGLIHGFQRQDYLSIANILKVFFIFIISLFLIYFFHLKTALVPVLAYSLYPLVLTLIFVFLFFKKIFPEFFQIKPVIPSQTKKEILRYSSFVMFTSVGGLILGYTDGVCINFYKGLNLVADYRNVAMPTTNIIRFFTSTIISVLFPMVSELWEKKNKDILSYGIHKAYLYIVAIAFPLALILLVFPTVVINLLFGVNYLSAAGMIQVLSFSAIFSATSGLGFSILNGMGKVDLSSRIIYIGAGLNLVLNLILIPPLGGVGAAIATLFSFLVMSSIQVRFINNYLERNVLSKKVIYVLGLSLVCLIPVLLLKNLVKEINVFFQILFCFGTYFGLYLMGAIYLKIIDTADLKPIIECGQKIIKRNSH